MIALVIPLHNLSFGGMSEKYLPPNNSVRLAQENFDKLFPGYRTNQLTLVIKSNNGSKVTDQQVAEIRNDAASINGFTDKTWEERACPGSRAIRASRDPRDQRPPRTIGAGDPERSSRMRAMRPRKSSNCGRSLHLRD